jgi:hypothetical protein
MRSFSNDGEKSQVFSLWGYGLAAKPTLAAALAPLFEGRFKIMQVKCTVCCLSSLC